MAKALILIVEDDESTSNLVRSILDGEHYGVSVAKTVGQARTLLRKARPDLLILDRNLPDNDGLTLCKELRESAEGRSLPILFLTARKSLSEKVLGLRMGGDDYLAKPFSPEELTARVAALLRRTGGAQVEPGSLSAGPIKVFLEQRAATLNGKPLDLTKKEFDLLTAFLERPARVLTRSFLLSHVWGYDMELQLSTKAVDVMVMGLRRKLGKTGSWIQAVKGYGFLLKDPDAAP